MSLCHHALGAVEHLLGEWPDSLASYHRSIDLARQVGSSFGLVLGSQRLAGLETKLGLYDQAHDRLLEAWQTAKDTQIAIMSLHSKTRILGTMAQNRLEAGDLAQALHYLAEGWAAPSESTECVQCDVLMYPVAVAVYLAIGDWEQARWACKRAEETAANFGSQAWSAVSVCLQGTLARATGEWIEAAHHFQQALDMFQGLDQPYDTALSMEALFDVSYRVESGLDQAQSKDFLERALHTFSRLGAISAESRTRETGPNHPPESPVHDVPVAAISLTGSLAGAPGPSVACRRRSLWSRR